MTELYCSPKLFYKGQKDKTCFNLNELKLLAREFNKKSPNSKIKGKTKEEIRDQLLQAYEKICDKHQFCWIRQTLTESEKIAKLEKAFRPRKPSSWDYDRNTWLNTYDILYVLEQYEELYKDFMFIGVYPIDFAVEENGVCIGDILCEFNIKKDVLDKKKKRFGIVFNTDPSTRGGEHWISLYCNLNSKRPNYGIYFYDSVGNSAPREVKQFMDKVVKQVADPKFKSHENTIQKQYDNYDCGVYSIVFLTQCLKNIKFEEICKRMKNDEGVNKLRDILYRPNIKH